MIIRLPRRSVLLGVGSSLVVAPWLRPLSADEVKLPAGAVQFRPEIEPLVQLIEQTPREKLFREIATRIRSGTSYAELLAATLLAGIRNVQPRPDVGFKFHCVMVVHAAHQATMAAKDEHRWFPLFWSMDYFKRCQHQDRNEGDWTMQAGNGNSAGGNPLQELRSALDAWDVERADAAVIAATATASSSQMLDLFARYGSRDFRNIGHKAIWVAGAFRTLEVIGWQHAEPVMRSLSYALLNHNGEPNPADNDLAADRAGKANMERASATPYPNPQSESDPAFVKEWLAAARTASPDALGEFTSVALKKSVSRHSISDAIHCAAAELVMRQPAIVSLHSVTSTNALQFLSRSVSDDQLRQWLLLQNASFIAHFRDSAAGRDKLSEIDILELKPADQNTTDVNAIFDQLGSNRFEASQSILAYLEHGGSPEAVQQKARELVFLKGNDSHDYKYSSAIFEDYYYCSPQWRPRLLAASSHLLTPANADDNDLKDRLAEAFG